MDIYNIENREFFELQQRFFYSGGIYYCLLCDYCCYDRPQMKGHQIENHGREDREALFLKLLNADSILDASYAEKQVYYNIFLGRSDNTIASCLGMNPQTVRSHRFKLRRKALESKVMLLLCDMMDLEKHTDASQQEFIADVIPGLHGGGNVVGFYTKARVHQNDDPIGHASVILLVAQRHSEGMRFLIGTKSSKMLTMAGKIEKEYTRWIDTMGGHCRDSDSADVKMGHPLPEDIFLNTCKRVLKKEVYIKGGQPDESKIMYLYTDATPPEGSELYPEGRNLEVSGVYLYRLPDGIPQDRIMVRDMWTDSVGGSITKRYPAEFVTWEEMERFLIDGDTALMDGARRVVERMLRDPELKARMFSMLGDGEA